MENDDLRTVRNWLEEASRGSTDEAEGGEHRCPTCGKLLRPGNQERERQKLTDEAKEEMRRELQEILAGADEVELGICGELGAWMRANLSITGYKSLGRMLAAELPLMKS